LSEEKDQPSDESAHEESQVETPTDIVGPPVTDTFLLQLRDIVKEEFTVQNAYIDIRDNLPIFIIAEDSEIKERSQRLSERLKPHNYLAVIRRVELFEGTGESSTVIKLVHAPPPKQASSYKVNVILFIVTVIAVLITGWFFATSPALEYIYVNFLHVTYNPFIVMIEYAIAILAIVGLHEFGHILASRRHKIEASLPYFIPGFYPWGTFGALIVQRSPPTTRDSLFDLGISGPLVGFLVSIITVIFGLMLSPTISSAQNDQLVAWLSTQGFDSPGYIPQPLLFQFIMSLLFMGVPSNYTIYAHPVAFAGWVGFVITGLNYFPVGQLDGGHVARSLFGTKYHQILSYITVFILFILGYWFMAIIVFFLFSGRHPGPVDDVSPLSTSRKIIGILSWFLPILLLPPMSLMFW
jgi:membrane-associated protease RseP (regulator of RpoE activity)